MKKTDVILLIILAVLLIFFGSFLIIKKNHWFSKGTNKPKVSKYEREVQDKLNQLTKNFYEDFYYDEIGKDEIKSIDQDTGLKIKLVNLLKYDSTIDEIKNTKSNSICNPDNTYVTIYPYEPYLKTDYKIEYHLECGDF